MRKGFLALLVALLVGVPAMVLNPPVQASPGDQYTSAYFGDGNLPPGCIRDMSPTNPANVCYHMRTGLNALDSPQVDVLVLVPVSPTAERDMRIMRQSVEMWESGIDYLAGETQLDWLKDVDFHITVDTFDPVNGQGGEFTTYPVVDPEIVVIATNPVGGIGIGVDPVPFVLADENSVPCHTIQNPLDFDYWENLPGFERHHDERVGTYTEDCGGAGGNVCFAINGAIDPAPEAADVFGLFDLVSHEFGHCLTVGHVGDGAEGDWGPLPSNDIMAYSQDPPGRTKCVSTLDMEGFAVRMSRYLDVNEDGETTEADHREANDQVGDGRDAFQVQHPSDHLYASSTGSPLDCPQPDLGLVPGKPTQWTPTPANSYDPVLSVTSPAAGMTTNGSNVRVTGTAERAAIGETADPTSPTATYNDPDNDATTPQTEIKAFDVEVTPTTVEATLSLADLWPSTSLASPVSYSAIIDGRRFDSFIRYAVDSNPMTWDNGAKAYMPAGSSTWNTLAKTVTFHIPRSYLATASIEAPYFVGSTTNVGILTNSVVDDSAPDDDDTLGVAAPARVIGVPSPTLQASSETVTFTNSGPGGNTFYPEDSSLGNQLLLVETGSPHTFTLDVPTTSDVTFSLSWTGEGSDLDLFVSGATNSGSTGVTSENPETISLPAVKGNLDIRVDPYLVVDAEEGAPYTLTAEVVSLGGDTDLDSDGDGVSDADDACPTVAGASAAGCPISAIEHIRVYVGGELAAIQDIDTANGPDEFDLAVDLPTGTHDLRTEWERKGKILASDTRSVTRAAPPPPDGDGDGARDSSDNCPSVANPDQSDMDRDGLGDACDPDTDGDGFSNDDEIAAGSNPNDPTSVPKKGKGKGRANGGPQGPVV